MQFHREMAPDRRCAPSVAGSWIRSRSLRPRFLPAVPVRAVASPRQSHAAERDGSGRRCADPFERT